MVHDRDADRPWETIMDLGQVAPWSIASDEFLRLDMGDRKVASSIAAVGNSTSTPERRRPEYAPGILQSNLFISSARWRDRSEQESQTARDCSGSRPDCERFPHRVASGVEIRRKKQSVFSNCRNSPLDARWRWRKERFTLWIAL